jgi:hypothetical protein
MRWGPALDPGRAHDRVRLVDGEGVDREVAERAVGTYAVEEHREVAPVEVGASLRGLSGQQLVPVLGDRARSGEVGLDRLDEPWLVGCDAVAVEQPLEVGE